MLKRAFPLSSKRGELYNIHAHVLQAHKKHTHTDIKDKNTSTRINLP